MLTKRFFCVGMMCAALSVMIPAPGHAQLGKLKDKIKKEAEKKLPKDKPADTPKPEAAETFDSVTTDSAAAPGDSFQLYTKFDFVPGQRVLYYDDLSGEEMG